MLVPRVVATVGVVLAAIAVFAWGTFKSMSPDAQIQRPPEGIAKHMPPGTKSLIVAGGCFWCLDSMFSQVKGVVDVESAYCGGSPAGVSYSEVCSETTGHAESIKIFYNPSEISETTLLNLFFASHDPTTLNRQGPDSGTSYRSAIFYTSPEEKALAEKVKADIERQKIWRDPIVTSIEPVKNYTPAEEYHQHYYQKYLAATPLQRMSMNGGYCNAIIQPHVLEFKERFAKYLKKQ
jgi:peptide-methionine (S)-S-oxide reductase